MSRSLLRLGVLAASLLTAALPSQVTQALERSPRSGKLATATAHLQLAAGDLAGALESMQIALSQEERAYGRNSLPAATALSRLALLRTASGDVYKAGELYRRALRIRERRLGPNHLGVARSLENLARLNLALATQNGQSTPSASKLLRRALRIRERQLGRSSAAIAIALYNLATSLKDKNVDSLPLLRRALSIRQHAYGPTSLPAAESMLKLAEAKSQFGPKPVNTDMRRESRAWCDSNKPINDLRRRALAIEEQRLGSDAPGLRPVLLVLANTDPCPEIGQADDRLALRKRIVAIDRKVDGPDAMSVALDLEAMLLLLATPEQASERRTTALMATAIREHHLALGRGCFNPAGLGAFERGLVTQFNAQADLRGIEIVDDDLLDHASFHELPSCQGNLRVYSIIRSYEKLGETDAAERVLRRYGGTEALADFLSRHGRYDEASAFYKQVLAQWESGDLLGSADYQRRGWYYKIIDSYVAVLRRTGAVKQAQPLLEKAVRMESAARDATASSQIRRLNALGDLYALEGRTDDAAAAYGRGLRLAESAGPESQDRGHRNSQWVLQQFDKVIAFDIAVSRFDDADALFSRSLAIVQPDYATVTLDYEKIQRSEPSGIYLTDPAKPPIVDRLERYAAFRRERGDAAAADEAHKRALSIWGVSLEEDLRNAHAILMPPGSTRDRYDAERLRLLVPIYRELSDAAGELRSATLLAAADARIGRDDHASGSKIR